MPESAVADSQQGVVLNLGFGRGTNNSNTIKKTNMLQNAIKSPGL